MARAPEQVVPRVHRLGTSQNNLHLVEEGGRLTLVDAGLPRYFADLLAGLAALGADLHDIDAVVLTHAHADRMGMAERLRSEAQARVHVHQADAQVARTGRFPPREGSIASSLWRPAALRFTAHTSRNGGRPQRVADVNTFIDGAVIDVPGSPRAVHTPGHSYGHSALHFAEHDLLVAGDALCSRNPLTGTTGPQLMPAPLNTSTETALRSLDRLEPIAATHVVFGHGDPWPGGVAEAVRRARDAVPA